MGSADQLGHLAGMVDRASLILGHRSGRAKRRIHFRDLPHHDKRGVLHFLANADWLGMIVASDTTSILPDSYLKVPGYQYNYALRYVIERLSQSAEEIGEPATIYIDQRRNFDLDRFRSYMTLLRNRRAPRIRWQYVDPRRICTASYAQQPNLVVADGVAHAGFKALEPDEYWDHCELAYLEEVKHKLWRGPAGANRIHDYGFVLMPTPQWGRFVAEYPWLQAL